MGRPVMISSFAPLDIVDGRTPFQRWIDGDGPRATPSYVYVASSWRNYLHAGVVGALKAAGIPCYDFRNPDPDNPENHGFSWKQVGLGIPAYPGENIRLLPPPPMVDAVAWRSALDHPVAQAGFASDRNGLLRSDCGVLVLPCGRSAHLECGYMAALGKPVFTLAIEPTEPDLMVLLLGPSGYICGSLVELLGKLGVED
jgi:hypothetical protein